MPYAPLPDRSPSRDLAALGVEIRTRFSSGIRRIKRVLGLSGRLSESEKEKLTTLTLDPQDRLEPSNTLDWIQWARRETHHFNEGFGDRGEGEPR